MSDRPVRRPLRKTDIPPDAPEADALDQARPVADEDDEEILPPALAADEPEADALDQARTVPLNDDDEEPA